MSSVWVSVRMCVFYNNIYQQHNNNKGQLNPESASEPDALRILLKNNASTKNNNHKAGTKPNKICFCFITTGKYSPKITDTLKAIL